MDLWSEEETHIFPAGTLDTSDWIIFILRGTLLKGNGNLFTFVLRLCTNELSRDTRVVRKRLDCSIYQFLFDPSFRLRRHVPDTFRRFRKRSVKENKRVFVPFVQIKRACRV